MRTAMTSRASSSLPSSFQWESASCMIQGSTAACVSFAIALYYTNWTRYASGGKSSRLFSAAYLESNALKEYSGNLHTYFSMKEIMHIVKKFGMVDIDTYTMDELLRGEAPSEAAYVEALNYFIPHVEYNFTKTAEEMKKRIFYHGGFVFGVEIRDPSSGIASSLYHCLCAIGYDSAKGILVQDSNASSGSGCTYYMSWNEMLSNMTFAFTSFAIPPGK